MVALGEAVSVIKAVGLAEAVRVGVGVALGGSRVAVAVRVGLGVAVGVTGEGVGGMGVGEGRRVGALVGVGGEVSAGAQPALTSARVSSSRAITRWITAVDRPVALG